MVFSIRVQKWVCIHFVKTWLEKTFARSDIVSSATTQTLKGFNNGSSEPVLRDSWGLTFSSLKVSK